MSDPNINKFPSTAHYDERGRYIHDKLNQPLAEAEAQGRTGAQPVTPREHGVRTGYCEKHVRLGCTEEGCQ